MYLRAKNALLGACIMTAFAVVSTTPAFAAERPVVKTTAVTSITADSATFNGEVNPEGLETKYYFEYGVSSYNKKTAEYSAGSGTSTLKKSVAVTGLLPGTTYKDVRIVATNSNGKEQGAAVSFKTLPPEFSPATGQSMRGTGGEFQLHYISGVITCTNEAMTAGAVTGKYMVGKVNLHFTGCVLNGNHGICEINSTNSEVKGEIKISPLKGQLGAVPTTDAPSGVGLLLEPESGGGWTTLAASCGLETPIFGKLAVAVGTLGSKQVTNKLTAALYESRNIREITLASGETVKPKLEAFSETTTLAGVNDVTFGEATEVT